MKRYLLLLSATILLFVAIPAIAVAIAPNDWGMVVCIALLLMANPLFFLIAGLTSPCKSKIELLLPLALVIIFFCTAKLIYGMGEPFYVFAYLAIFYVAMIIRCLVIRSKRRKAEEKKMHIQDL